MNKKVALGTIFLLVALSFSAFAADLTSLVPADSAFIININLTKIFASDTIKKQIEDGMAKQTAEQKKAYDDFVAKTGIDPMKSLKEVCMFMSTQGATSGEKPKGGVFISGTFDSAKIIEAIKSDPAAAKDTTVEKFEGYDAIKGKKDPDSLGVFLDANTAVIGNAAVVKSVIAIKAGKEKNLATNATFAGLLKKVDLGAAVYGAGLIPATVKEQAKANPQAAPLAALNTLFFAFNYEPDLSFSFTGEVDKKENMDGVMTALNGFLAMVKMMAAQTPEAGEILNLVKIESADTAAKLSLNVPKAKLQEIRKKIEDRMKAPGAGATPAPAPGTK
jgi:hypothetical protein